MLVADGGESRFNFADLELPASLEKEISLSPPSRRNPSAVIGVKGA
jgi:hypothetical protein